MAIPGLRRGAPVDEASAGPRPRTVAAVMTGAFAGVLMGCAGAAPSRLEAYCGAVQDNIAAINSPSIATEADIADTIDLYRSIAERAPLGVAPEWDTMVASLETASTVVLGDPGSVAAANDAALAGQPAYTRIQQYTKSQCGTDIGTPAPPTNPAFTTVPASPAPSPAG